MIPVLIWAALASDLRSEWKHSFIDTARPAAQVLRALGAGPHTWQLRHNKDGAVEIRRKRPRAFVQQNHRVWPFTEWRPSNSPPLPIEKKPAKTSSAKELTAPFPLPDPPAKLTMVIQGYAPRRKANYHKLWEAYGTYDRAVDKIIFIWNNVDNPPPDIPNNTAVPIQFIQAHSNVMTNRINVLDYLRTEAVMVVDDDVILNRNLVHCMLHSWRKNPDRMVGLDERSVTDKGDYFNGPIMGKHGMVLGKTMLFSSKYIKPFFSDVGLVKLAAHECDDIALNAFISKQSGMSPLVVIQDPAHIRNLLPDTDGVSIITKNWYNKRSDCVHLMRDHFGMNVFMQSRDIDVCE